MIKTLYGTIYTKDREEAYKFRILDKSPNWQAIKGNTLLYQKYVKLFHYDKATKTYWLPPITWDESKTKCGSGVEIEVKPIMKLWEGQQKSVDFCYNEINNGTSSILIVSETATGKSIQMLGIIEKFKYRTLITVPSEAIGFGLQEKLEQYCNAKYMNGAMIRKSKYNLPDVLITHRQSAVNCRDIINGYYDLMLNDEQHHLSDGMKMLCNTRKGIGIIGLSGTPFRKEMDKQDFLKYFQKMYETGLKSLPVRVLTHKYRHTYTMDDYMKACEGLEPESPEVLRRLVNNNDDKIFDLKKLIGTLYSKCNFKKFIVFVDRLDYQKRIKELVFPNAILINGETDKEKVLEEMKSKDEFLAIGMVTASGEGFDVPGIEVGVLFFSTTRAGSLEQMVGRAKRFADGKEYAYRVDVQESSKIEPDQYKGFGQRDRMKYYKQRGRPVITVDEYVRSLSDNTKLFNY